MKEFIILFKDEESNDIYDYKYVIESDKELKDIRASYYMIKERLMEDGNDRAAWMILDEMIESGVIKSYKEYVETFDDTWEN